MSVLNEGAAPQNVTPAIETSAYYVGTSFFDGLKYHTFHKNFSDRGLLGTGNRSPHGRDLEATYHSLIKGSEVECALVRGAPYSLSSVSIVIAGSSRSYLVECSKPITPTPSGTTVSLPFLRGLTSPYRHDPRFTFFNPVLGQD